MSSVSNTVSVNSRAAMLARSGNAAGASPMSSVDLANLTKLLGKKDKSKGKKPKPTKTDSMFKKIIGMLRKLLGKQNAAKPAPAPSLSSPATPAALSASVVDPSRSVGGAGAPDASGSAGRFVQLHDKIRTLSGDYNAKLKGQIPKDPGELWVWQQELQQMSSQLTMLMTAASNLMKTEGDTLRQIAGNLR